MKIVIVGRPNEGKTSFAYLISEMLKEKGFDVNVNDSDYAIKKEFLVMNIDKIIKSLSNQFEHKNKTIEIETQQSRRDSLYLG